ncbi:MAG: SGNH/GDSL hydrolase family protein [bacterium]
MRIIRICYFGDSITYGFGDGSESRDITKRWTSIIDDGLKKYKKQDILFNNINLGVNGDTTRNGLERLKDIYVFNPDIITIQFGMNDCNYWLSDNGFPRVNPMSFEYNLLELIEKCYTSGIKEIILSTNHLIPIRKLMLNNKDYNENNRYYNSIIRKVAKKTNTILCDIEALFDKASKDKSFFLNENGKRLHLSQKGNELYAEKMLPFIEKTIKNSIRLKKSNILKLNLTPYK